MLCIAQRAVRNFHWKMGCEERLTPGFPIDRELRIHLMMEEMSEIVDALDNSDLPGVADGIADLLYVTLGTAVACGIDMDPIFEAVHRANMAKEGGGVRPDGKILKPEGWTAPDVAGLLKEQGWIP